MSEKLFYVGAGFCIAPSTPKEEAPSRGGYVYSLLSAFTGQSIAYKEEDLVSVYKVLDS